ncbi:MAG: acetyl-coenzyme A synthetase N-terminal domain-containing protein, partial [Terriglobales bacterium]
MDQQETFQPPQHFRDKASIRSMEEYQRLYDEAARDPEKFWGERAGDLHWFAPWTKVLDWSNPPFAMWFVGGRTNVAYNCLDRHLTS